MGLIATAMAEAKQEDIDSGQCQLGFASAEDALMVVNKIAFVHLWFIFRSFDLFCRFTLVDEFMKGIWYYLRVASLSLTTL